MTKRVTRRQAEAALRAVEKQFKTYLEPLDLGDGGRVFPPVCPPPTLSMDWDGHVAILWEDGPDEWAYRASMGGNSEEDRVLAASVAREFDQDPQEAVSRVTVEEPVKWPKGVWAEPYYSFVLCLYPED